MFAATSSIPHPYFSRRWFGHRVGFVQRSTTPGYRCRLPWPGPIWVLDIRQPRHTPYWDRFWVLKRDDTSLSMGRGIRTFSLSCSLAGMVYAHNMPFEKLRFKFVSIELSSPEQEPIEGIAFDPHHQQLATATGGCAKVWRFDQDGRLLSRIGRNHLLN